MPLQRTRNIRGPALLQDPQNSEASTRPNVQTTRCQIQESKGLLQSLNHGLEAVRTMRCGLRDFRLVFLVQVPGFPCLHSEDLMALG